MPRTESNADHQRRQFVKNGIWLYVLQAFNTVLPLLVIPFVTRRLGAVMYGEYSIAANWIGYFQVLIIYGFDLSGSRRVALAKDRPTIEMIYGSILKSKLILCLLSTIILAFLVIISPIGEQIKMSLMLLGLMLWGEALSQTWLFQGMQRMEFIAITSVFAKGVSTAAILLFVNEADLFIFCILTASASLLLGLLHVAVIRLHLKIRVAWQKLDATIEMLKEGWPLFMTSMMSRLVVGFGVTSMGILGVSTSEIGAYSALYKIPMLITLAFAPISQILFPYVCTRYELSLESGLKLSRRLLLLIVPLFAVTVIVLMLFAEDVSLLAFGQEYVNSYRILYPLLLWAIFGIVNNFLGVQQLIASGNAKRYTKAFSWGVIALVLGCLGFGQVFGMIGIAWAQLFSEIVLFAGNSFEVRKLQKELY